MACSRLNAQIHEFPVLTGLRTQVAFEFDNAEPPLEPTLKRVVYTAIGEPQPYDRARPEPA